MDNKYTSQSSWILTGLSQADRGKYSICDEEYPLFLDLFHHHCFEQGKTSSLLERHQPVAPILIDLDFKYASLTPSRTITPTHYREFCDRYAAAFFRFFEHEEIQFFVCQKPDAEIEIGKGSKDGLHIVCPYIVTVPEIQYALRGYMLDTSAVQETFHATGYTNADRDVFDHSVIRSNNWFLYGASKEKKQPYKLVAVYTATADSCDENDVSEWSSHDLVHLLSIRNKEETPLTLNEDNITEWNALLERWKGKEPTKQARTTALSTTSNPHRIEHISVADTNPGDCVSLTGSKLTGVCDDDRLRPILLQIPAARWDNYEDWLKIGIAIFNEGGSVELWDEMSRNSDKYEEGVCKQKWSSFQKRTDKKITIRTLKTWVADHIPLDSQYEKTKQEFEQKVFRVLDPPGYMVQVRGKWISYTRYQLIDMHSGIFLDAEKKHRFIDWWLRDDNIRTYDALDYYIDTKLCPTSIFNTFTGFAAQHITDEPSTDITPILHHIDILCNHDKESAEFVLDFFASILQYPTILNHICLVLMGDHGCGKDIFLTWFGIQIIGKSNYYKTSRPDKDLFDTFNTSRMNVVLYHIEEANNKTITDSNMEQFKNYITDSYASINRKNKNTTIESLVPNINHFVVSTNLYNPFTIHKTQRRHYAVEASSEKCKHPTYFKELHQHMNNTKIIKGFYNFLMERNIEQRNWMNPPKTSAMERWYTLCMPLLEPFVEYFRDGPIDKYRKDGPQSPGYIQSSKLYNEYILWCNLEVDGEIICQEPVSSKVFGNEMKKIHGVSSSHTKLGNFFTI